MNFFKNLFNIFQEGDDNPGDDNPSTPEEYNPREDNFLLSDTINTQDLNLSDLLQSGSLSDDFTEEIATEMLQELNNSQLIDYFEKNHNTTELQEPYNIVNLDDLKDIFNVDKNSHRKALDNTPFNSINKISVCYKVKDNVNSNTKPAHAYTEDLNTENANLMVFDDKVDINDRNIPGSTITREESKEHDNTDTDTNIKVSPEINLDDILYENINTVMEKLNSKKAFQIAASQDVSKSIQTEQKILEVSKAINDFNKNNMNECHAKERNELSSVEDENITNNVKIADTLEKNIIDNNIHNENVDEEPKSSTRNKEGVINTNTTEKLVKVEENIDIESTNNITKIIEIPSKNEPTNELLDENEILTVIELIENDKFNLNTNVAYSQELDANTDWEKLIDEIKGKKKNEDVKMFKNSTSDINSENQRDEAAVLQNSEVLDIISASSESCIILDSDYCSGYHSSDFEFINESDAETDGFIINVTNKKFKTNSGEKIDCKTISPNPDFNQNVSSSSSSPDSKNNEDKATRHNIYDPNEDYSYRNHVRYLPHLEFDNNLEHRIPEGDEYLNLFQGIYAPIMTTQMFFMENKSIGSAKSMDANFNGLGFDIRRMVMVDDADEECRREAEETHNRILEMYPGTNRRRRRRRRPTLRH